MTREQGGFGRPSSRCAEQPTQPAVLRQQPLSDVGGGFSFNSGMRTVGSVFLRFTADDAVAMAADCGTSKS